MLAQRTDAPQSAAVDMRWSTLSSESDAVDLSDLALRAKTIVEREAGNELGALVELLKPASSTFANLAKANTQDRYAAECVALLAEAMQGSVNPRRYYSQICALCSVANRLDSHNDRARFVRAKEFERDSCFARAIKECDAIDGGSPLKSKAREFGELCEEKKVQLVRQLAKKSTQDRESVLKQGGSSPIKLLDGIGKGTAEKFGTEATTLNEASKMMAEGKVKLSDGRTKAAADKISKCNKALSWTDDAAAQDLDKDLLLVRKIFAQSCDAEEVIMTWNAMASAPIHATDGEWPEMLVRKASNIARAAKEQRASILVVQECPGKHLERNGGTQARKVASEDKFKSELVAHLDPRDKWQAVSVDVPCLKEDEESKHAQQYVKREDARKGGWSRLGGGAEEGEKRVMVDHGEKHVVAWDSAVWKLSADFRPAHIGRRAGAAATPQDGEWKSGDHGGEGGPFYRPPALVVLERSDGWRAPLPSGPPPRVAVLSVHLKSGGKAETEEEVRKVARLGAQCCREALQRGGGWRAGDAIVIIGDFNLEPGHPVFAEEESLARQGFVFAGDSERPTNQAEFIVGEGKTYDGAWVWRAGAEEGEGVSGRVVEVGELEEVKRERAEIAKQMWRVLKETVPQTPTTKAVRAALLDEYDEREGCFRFLGEAFKRQVTRSWSDHKPVCVALAPLAGRA